MQRVALLPIVFLCWASAAGGSSFFCEDNKLDAADWVRKYLQSSAFVVLAEVTASKRNEYPTRPRDALDDVKTMKDLLELIEEDQKSQYFLYEATLLISKSWKGSDQSSLNVSYNALPGNYGFELKLDNEYLVFGSQLPSGEYAISTICGLTTHKDVATDKISALEKLKSGMKAPQKGS